MPLRITPSVAEQEGQQTETEATGAPQKHHYTLNQQVGSITDLVVKNVIVITLDNANEESESYYQISCQFKFRHLDDQRRIEKILLDLILEAKRKKRI